MSGPDRCDVSMKDGTYYELIHKEFLRLDAMMKTYAHTARDQWVRVTGISGGRIGFLLSCVQSMEESTVVIRETRSDIERMYRNERGWTPDD
jgi:hypothetical protein